MDWKTFISNVIDSLAWPGVVVTIVFLLREKVGELIPRLKRFKHKDTEVEFTEAIAELVQERGEAGIEDVESPRTGDYQDQFSFLMRLADISPRSAVLESFRAVEAAAAKKAARLYPEIESRHARSPIEFQKMLKGKALSKMEYHQFNQLRKLRNEAAHAEDFDISGIPIEAYVDIALSLAARLDHD